MPTYTDKQLIQNIMSFVRRDGPSTAPICFLTIEDGGDLWEWDGHKRSKTLENFQSYFLQENAAWEPKSADELWQDGKQRLGKPGIAISIIMSVLRTNSDKGSTFYRSKEIYLRNECNVKFYPIGRKTQSFWSAEMEEFLGLSHAQYMDLCYYLRPRVLVETLRKDLLTTDKLYVILGAKSEWITVLSEIFKGTDKEIDFIRSASENWTNAKWRNYEIYFDNDNRLLFGYINMFRRGVSTADYTSFAQSLRKYWHPAIEMIEGYTGDQEG